MTKRYQNTIAISALTLTLALAGAGMLLSKEPAGIELPEKGAYSIGGKALSEKQTTDLRARLAGLRPVAREMYRRADCVITIDTAEGQEVYSVWLPGGARADKKRAFAGGFIYRGDDLSAWSERMAGRRSKGHRIDSATAALLRDLIRGDRRGDG